MLFVIKHKVLLADTVPERFTIVHCTLLLDWWLCCGPQGPDSLDSDSLSLLYTAWACGEKDRLLENT